MGLVIRLIELLIVVVPLIGLIFAGMKAVSAAQARRSEDAEIQTGPTVLAALQRPAKAEDLLDDREAAHEYLDAVENYATAFNVAEAEAIRRRRTGFSDAEQQRLSRAQNLLRVASNSAATPQEREHAYTLAGRELDGLVVLPERARSAIEQGIAGELDA